MFIRVIVLTTILLTAGTAWADAFDVTYSGRLTEFPSGNPVEGPVDLELRFFAGQTSATELTPAKVVADVALTAGVFAMKLPLTVDERETVFKSPEVWIGITDTTNDKVYPRQRFTGVPYALKVPVDPATLGYDGNGLLFVKNSAATSFTQSNSQFIATDEIKARDTDGLKLSTATASPVAITTNGAERLRVDATGKVGIGTTNPSTALDVNGVISLFDAGAKTRNAGIESEVGGKVLNIGINDGPGNRFGGTYTPADQGGFFRVDTRSPQPLFSLMGRNAGGTSDVDYLMSVTSSGNVGIGTENPIRKLEVGSTQTDNSFMNFESHLLSRATANGVIYNYGSGIDLLTGYAAGTTVTGTSMAQRLRAFRNQDAGLGDTGTLNGGLWGQYMQYGHGNTDPAATPITDQVMGLLLTPYGRTGTINNLYDIYIGGLATGGTVTNHWAIYQNDAAARNYFGGSVGIGTDTPAAALDVKGTAQQVQLAVHSFTSQGSYLAAFYTPTGQIGLGINSNGGLERPLATGGDMALSNGGTYSILLLTDGAERMRVDSSGYVGIGTSNPEFAKLRVSAPNGVVRETVESGANFLTSAVADNADPTFIYKDSTDLRFATGTTYYGLGYSEKMRLTATGSLGIGSATPAATLDVNGYARLAKYATAPVACDAAHDGAIAFTTVNYLCVCISGTGWRRASDGSTACSTW